MIPGFERVTRRKPCPICGKPQWCLHGPDGISVCKRVMSNREFGEAGWIHGGELRRPSAESVVQKYVRPERNEAIEALYAKICQEQPGGASWQIASDHGIPADGAIRLGAVWHGIAGALAFPMRNASGACVGIRYRAENGRKWAAVGSWDGLFYDAMLAPTERAWVCEGPTDTAAMLELGFYVYGRPSCRGASRILVTRCVQQEHREVVIVADSDTPGQDGADAMAEQLVVAGVKVKVIVPTGGHKDARAWIAAGATAARIERVARNAQWWRGAPDAVRTTRAVDSDAGGGGGVSACGADDAGRDASSWAGGNPHGGQPWAGAVPTGRRDGMGGEGDPA